MTTNPETAGVEPVAWMYASPCGVSAHVSIERWSKDSRTGWAETALGPINPPAAREDGEAVQKCELYRAAKRLSDNIAEFGTITDGIFVEDLDRAVEAMRENPFCDDIATLGTTQQDMRMEHYGRVTLAAMPTPAAIRAETTAQIVAWLLGLANSPLTHPILAFIGDPCREDGRELAERLAAALDAGDHLTGGGE